MKTTTLFKMAGSWSPLWQLSDKPWFEITSHEFLANVTIGCDCGLPISFMSCQKAVEALLSKHHLDALTLGGSPWMPKLSSKQMNIFDSPKIVFSEYHDPNSFSVPSCEQVAI